MAELSLVKTLQMYVVPLIAPQVKRLQGIPEYRASEIFLDVFISVNANSSDRVGEDDEETGNQPDDRQVCRILKELRQCALFKGSYYCFTDGSC